MGWKTVTALIERGEVRGKIWGDDATTFKLYGREVF
jgi:hypothetical protein